MSEDILALCNRCNKIVVPIVETGYESGQFPTAYEDYYTCPICGEEIQEAYVWEIS